MSDSDAIKKLEKLKDELGLEKMERELAEGALEKAGKESIGKKLAKAIPFFGIPAGIAAAVWAWKKGNKGEAALDVIGLVPVAGDLVDAARLGVDIGRAADEECKIGETALEFWGDFAADIIYED